MQNAIQFLLIYLFYLHSLKVLRHILYRVLYFFPTNWSFPTTRKYKMSRRRPRKCKIEQCSVPARALLSTCSLHARYDLHAWYWVNIVEIFCFVCCLLFYREKDRKYSNPTKSSVTAWKEKSYMDWRYPGWYINNILFVTLFYKKKHQSEIKKRSLTVYMDWRHPGWHIYDVILSSPCFITKITHFSKL